MGDSDDEYDRKRRDKFRGEREANYRGGVDRPLRPREDWPEREPWARPRPREYRNPRDRGYSPSIDQSAKRMRHDYYPPPDGHFYPYAPYHPAPLPHREPLPHPVPPTADSNPSAMMSFKAFLATQDDNISDSDAIEKYNEYKLEFQRQQLNEFFVAHKEEEWFRLKYHPEDAQKRKDEQMAALKKRLDVFTELLSSDKLKNVNLDVIKSDDLIKLLDTVVIKLEGGTEADLSVLDEVTIINDVEKKDEVKVVEVKKEKVDDEKDEKAEKTEEKESEKMDVDEGKDKEDKDKDNAEKEDKDITREGDAGKPTEEVTNGEKDQEKDVEKKVEKKKKNKKEKEDKHKRSSSSSSSSSSSDSESEIEESTEPVTVKVEKLDSDEEEAEKSSKSEKRAVQDDKPKPRALHKTTSIFLRNLAPSITKQEVETICARYGGFLRVALADPQPERRWLRRGWVTFARDANIKEICWNLNNIRLRDCELGAIVNRDLSRRIRPVNGITAHKQIVKSDIRISAKVAMFLDAKAKLWVDEESEKPEQTYSLHSNNPVLKNITDYLIEEASAEEEELLGLDSSKEDDANSTVVDRDDQLIDVLDRILLYLRIVHSVDYYNHCEYPNEDEMPNRCGILHARGPAPISKTDMVSYLAPAVEQKMAHFLPEKQSADNTDQKQDKLLQLAMKDEEAEVEKFILANTRELSKEKWLCPLSGKKFKGPEFIRKHIFNKHGEKVDDVRKEVQFFNNYLKDQKRPMIQSAEPQQPTPATKREGHDGPGPYLPPAGYPPNLYPPYAPMRPAYYQPLGGYNPRPRGGFGRGPRPAAMDMRPVIHYRDLDAPREPEEFI